MMQVTTGETGGNPVVWGADSRHLFHASATPRPSDGDPLRDGMAVIELVTEPGLAVIRRRTMRGLPPNEGYDLSPDGRTFVAVSPLRAKSGIVVVVNWGDEARREWRGADKP